MTEAVEERAVEEELETKVPDTQQAQSGKTFAQDEVNRLIAKEKAAWKKQSERASADNETIVEGLRKDITKRDEVITKQLELLEKDLGLDEGTQELLAGLDTVARYEWVLKRIEKSGKKEIPGTPPAEGRGINAQPFRRTQTV